MHTGGCLCGGIRFRVQGNLAPIELCHCSQCRKAQGGPFASNIPVAAAAFRRDASCSRHSLSRRARSAFFANATARRSSAAASNSLARSGCARARWTARWARAPSPTPSRTIKPTGGRSTISSPSTRARGPSPRGREGRSKADAGQGHSVTVCPLSVTYRNPPYVRASCTSGRPGCRGNCSFHSRYWSSRRRCRPLACRSASLRIRRSSGLRLSGSSRFDSGSPSRSCV
jgi:hypothetical protein